MHERRVEELILCTLLSKDALWTQDLAAVTSAHAALCHSPQASSPSLPISAQARMDRMAAFCATHSPQLTPLSLGTIVCLSFLKGRQRSVADEAKSCYVKRGAWARHPCIPWSPRALLQRHCLGSFVCQPYPFRIKVSRGGGH